MPCQHKRGPCPYTHSSQSASHSPEEEVIKEGEGTPGNQGSAAKQGKTPGNHGSAAKEEGGSQGSQWSSAN